MESNVFIQTVLIVQISCNTKEVAHNSRKSIRSNSGLKDNTADRKTLSSFKRTLSAHGLFWSSPRLPAPGCSSAIRTPPQTNCYTGPFWTLLDPVSRMLNSWWKPLKNDTAPSQMRCWLLDKRSSWLFSANKSFHSRQPCPSSSEQLPTLKGARLPGHAAQSNR